MLLIVGMVQLGKITYVYYTLKKTLYTAARAVATQQNVNPCDAADPGVQAAIGFALTGSTDHHRLEQTRQCLDGQSCLENGLN